MKKTTKSTWIVLVIIVALTMTGRTTATINTSSIVPRTSTICADKDTYVSSYGWSINHGSETDLAAGYNNYSYTKSESYLRFNLTGKPADFSQAMLRLYTNWRSVDQSIPVNLSIWRVEDSWNEMTLTWSNDSEMYPRTWFPPRIEFIANLSIAANGYFLVNLTEACKTLDTISLCINSSQHPTGSVLFFSREVMVENQRPSILFTYEGDCSLTITNPPDGGRITRGETRTITWQSSGDVQRVCIQLFTPSLVSREFITDGTDPVDPFINYTIDDGAYEWEVGSMIQNGEYILKIWDYEAPTLVDQVTISISDLTVDASPVLFLVFAIMAIVMIHRVKANVHEP